MDKKFKASAYPTPRRIAYNGQQDLSLWGDPLPQAVRTHIGYQWNAAATEIADVSLIYPFNRTPLWHYSIANGRWVAGAEPIQLPAPEAMPAAPAKFRSTIVKDDNAKKGKKKA